jgi:hypothetical protein
MKTIIIILGLLTVSCGRFDEEGQGSDGNVTAVEDSNKVYEENDALWDIAKQPLESDEYSFDLRSILIHEADVKGDMNTAFDYWKTPDGQKKSKFFKKMPDGSLKDCNVRVFIGLIHKFNNTNKDQGVLLFTSAYVGNEVDPCKLGAEELIYKFVNGKVELKSTLYKP